MKMGVKYIIPYFFNNKNKKTIFLQYTGLDDKTGKKIYEGDIVKANCALPLGHYLTMQGEVIFTVGKFIVRNKKYEASIANAFEVLGNIFENPELLNENQN